MTNTKIDISDDSFDINLHLYVTLKLLVKCKLTDNQLSEILSLNILEDDPLEDSILLIENFINNSLRSLKKQLTLQRILEQLNSKNDLLILLFSLKLMSIKDLLLAEAKLKHNVFSDKLKVLHPLSLEYDRLTVHRPYSTRVQGALLALILFDKLDKGETDFLTLQTENFLRSLSNEAIKLKGLGVESNQIFMLLFTEVINQSIISDSGTDYEKRIKQVLIKGGIPASGMSKQHDAADSSTEYDIFFTLEGRTFGIGAKRTLRERYKQFIKTAISSDIDVMIEITIGMDLTEEKAKTIRQHGVYLFVSDEIYERFYFLQCIDGIYPASQLQRSLLITL